MGSKNELCRTCRFWLDMQHKGEGQCRRHAPQPRVSADNVRQPDDVNVVWPMMLDCDWCGEWQGEPEDS